CYLPLPTTPRLPPFALFPYTTLFRSDRYLPRLDHAVHEVESTGLATLLSRAAETDERLFMARQARLEDWRRRWTAVRGWFASDGTTPTRAAELGAATRSAVSGVIALLRQITESQRGGV